MQVKLIPKDLPKMEHKVEQLTSIPARLTPGERRKIGDRIRLGFQHSFTTEGHGGWAPLVPSTVENRRRIGGQWGVSGAHPILKLSGSLRSSWVDRSDRNHWEQWGSFASMTVATVGSVHRLAPYHSGGTATMPARRVEVLADEDLQGIGDTVGHVFSERLKRGG